MLMVSLKDPFIDDFAYECPICEPGRASAWLKQSSRQAARAEEELDRRIERARFHEQEDEE